MTRLAYLRDRAVLRMDGTDRVSFLNGLVSNDVALVAPGRAIWAALLTPQGKYLADFFILADDASLLLECEAAQLAMIAARLARYRLRADVTIAPCDLAVYVAWAGVPPEGTIAVPDPRLPAAGWRVLAQAPLEETAAEADWQAHRLALGLPDGTRDMEPEKSVLLEGGFDELGGISWTKGCYMGQELTARTRYRGLLKRRLLPVQGTTALPPAGTPVMAEGREVGVMRSAQGVAGLALLRLDSLHLPLSAGGADLHVRVPDWVTLPDAASF